jgi:hypothetical protein
MRIFRTKARTAESYLAGIGASGALLGSAFVVFVILVGVVTFNVWPHAGRLLGDGDEPGVLKTTATPAPVPASHPGICSLVRLPGGAPGGAGPRGGARGGAPTGNGSLPDGTGRLPGQPGATPPGSTPPGSTAPSSTPPGSTGSGPAPSPPPSGGGPLRNAVSQTVSNVGNAVQTSTDGLGDALGGSDSPGVGGVVGGVGKALNDQLQSLAGGG